MHPATLILVWCVSVMLFTALPLFAMLAASAAMLSLAALLSMSRLRQLLRRTRWIMFSLLLIYAYTTAGQALIPTWGLWSPTLEGLSDGVLQLSRLLAALSGLAILLHTVGRGALIAGLYQIFTPLQWLGIARDRLAVRLALTLQYAEAALLSENKSGLLGLNGLFQSAELDTAQANYIEIQSSRFDYRDVLLLLVSTLFLMLVWLQ